MSTRWTRRSLTARLLVAELIKPLKGIQETVWRTIESIVAQAFQRRLEHIGDETIGKLPDRLSGMLVQFGQPTVEALKLAALNALQSGPKSGDHWVDRWMTRCGVGVQS